jgi:hypothetical protein
VHWRRGHPGVATGTAAKGDPLLALAAAQRYRSAMKIPVSANGDRIIPWKLVAELIAEPGEGCFVELDEAGARITVTRMDPALPEPTGPLRWSATPTRSSGNFATRV